MFNSSLFFFSLQCRRILGGRNLVRFGNIVVAAIFDFKCRVEIVTLTVGARAKGGKGGGGEEKKPPLFGKFQHGAFASKFRAQRKRLHCRLGEYKLKLCILSTNV